MLFEADNGSKTGASGQFMTEHKAVKALNSMLARVGGIRLLYWSPKDPWSKSLTR